MTADFDTRLRQSSARWLAEQSPPRLRIAREIIRRREALKQLAGRPDRVVTTEHENGIAFGLLLALSYLGDRPGDISPAGAEGYLSQVGQADELAAKGMEP
jgi:hypothetical protein